MVWQEYPYTNFHDLNMDWILKTLKSIDADITTLNEWKAAREIRDQWLDDSIEDLNTKYEALVALYNTFVDEVNARFDALSEQITDQVNALEASVNARVTALEAQINRQLADLAAELRAEVTAFKNEVNALLLVYNNRIVNVEEGLVRVENMIPNMMNIIDPYTGQQSTIVNVIYEIVNRTKQNALTASAYDAAQLTATAYDALNLSAYEYDFNGADYIN